MVGPIGDRERGREEASGMARGKSVLDFGKEGMTVIIIWTMKTWSKFEQSKDGDYRSIE